MKQKNKGENKWEQEEGQKTNMTKRPEMRAKLTEKTHVTENKRTRAEKRQ